MDAVSWMSLMWLGVTIAAYLAGFYIGRSIKPPMRDWCVFDTAAPDVNQGVYRARTPDEAVAKCARETFDLDVEEIG